MTFLGIPGWLVWYLFKVKNLIKIFACNERSDVQTKTWDLKIPFYHLKLVGDKKYRNKSDFFPHNDAITRPDNGDMFSIISHITKYIYFVTKVTSSIQH